MRYEDVPIRPTAEQLALLRAHRPYSLPLLRRLQTAAGALEPGLPADAIPEGTSQWAHILFVYNDEADEDETAGSGAFAAAFVDMSKAPETQVWLYASDEDVVDGTDRIDDALVVDRGAALTAGWSAGRRARVRRLVRSLLRRVRSLAAEQSGRVDEVAEYCTEQVKVALHDGVRHVLVHPEAAAAVTGSMTGDIETTAVTFSYWDAYDKWLIRAEDVPRPVGGTAGKDLLVVPGLEKPLSWDVVRKADVPLVQSRTHIVRKEATLLLLPSVALRDPTTEVLVAWTFLGLDGSIWTLHCEETHRGRGLAKALAARLILEHNGIFGRQLRLGDDHPAEDDGWCLADVSATNVASQAVCRSVGGKRTWSFSWNKFNYESFGDDVPGEWAIQIPIYYSH